MEIKKIPGYENYTINTNGEIFSSDGKKMKQMFRNKHRKYLCVHLFNGEKYKTFSVHSLVLQSFIGPRPKNYDGAHLDGNPQNNSLSNLSWVSKKENCNHRDIHNTTARGSNHGKSKITEEDVIWLRNNYVTINRSCTNIVEISKKVNLHWKTARRIIAGESWKHVGGNITPMPTKE